MTVLNPACTYYIHGPRQNHNIVIYVSFLALILHVHIKIMFSLIYTHTHTHTHTLPPSLPPSLTHSHPHSLPHSLTCKQKLVSCDSLDNVQHVARQRDIGTLGLTFKLLQHLSKDRVLLREFLQRLESFVKLADVLGVELQVGCPAQKDVSNSRVGGPEIL